MEGHDKKRIYITAGIVAALLLLAILMIALGGNREANEPSSTASGSERTAAVAMGDAATDAAVASESTGTEAEGATGAEVSEEESDPLPQGSGAERAATKVEIAPVESGAPETAVQASTGVSAPAVVIPKEGYILYTPSRPKLRASYQNIAYDTENELKVMFDYWKEANLDAVRDLIALPRYEAITATLKGSNDYYYYGDRNATGQPHGKGLAVYADNQYYYGDFANGVRSGKGEWLQSYPVYMDDVMIEHYYTGEWARDLPNGKGQDHFEYDENKMNEEQLFLLNAIGTFKDGVYDGEMYVMFERPDGSYTEWSGNCKESVFDVFGAPDDHARVAILRNYHDEDHYIWVKPDRNADFRVRHLIAP